MPIDTKEKFDLCQDWLERRGDPELEEESQRILQRLDGLNEDPTLTGLDEQTRRERVLELERIRLEYHHILAELGQITLIAPEVSSYLSETSAAYLLDSMGLGRKGKSQPGHNLHPHDLVNMFEVKENQRSFPNIDIPLYGKPVRNGRWTLIKVNQKMTNPLILKQLNGYFARVTNQICNRTRSCTIQRFTVDDSNFAEICKLRGRREQICVVKTRKIRHWKEPEDGRRGRFESKGTTELPPGHENMPENGLYLRLGKNQHFESSEAGWFMLRQESGNVNFNSHTWSHHAQTLANGILFVSRHLDVIGRHCVSFIRVPPRDLAEAQEIMPVDRENPQQWQPYLMGDNVRDCYYGDGDGSRVADHNSIFLCGGELIAHYIDTDSGLEEAFWNRNGVQLGDQNVRDLLLTGNALDGRRKPLSPDWNKIQKFTSKNRKKFLEEFLATTCRFSRETRIYTDETNTSRKVWVGKETEIIVSLRYGIRGDRSTARGEDIIENSGQSSEVKQVTGQRGDAQFTLDAAPPINRIGQKHRSYRRIYIGRFYDKLNQDSTGGSNLRIKLQYINIKPLIISQIEQYFEEQQPESNFQYHSGDYDSNYYGSDARNFTANVDFEYIEGKGFSYKAGWHVRLFRCLIEKWRLFRSKERN